MARPLTQAPPRPGWQGETEGSPYLRVPIENLLAGSTLPFSLYYFVDGSFILYRGAGKRFEKSDRTKLLDSHITELHVPRTSQARYRQYLDGCLRRLLAATDVAPAKRVEAFYSMAAGIARDVLERPDRAESVTGALEVVQSSLVVLEGGKEVLHRLMGFMTGQYDLAAHSINVTNYGLALARAAGMKEPRTFLELGLGLLFHDAGLLKIPPRILRKKGPLTFDERAVYAQHPLRGFEIFQGKGLLPDVSTAIIRDHHERIDGSGYPRGVGAGELGLGARIAQIVEEFDSLTCHQPGRRAVSTFDAIRGMGKDQKGSFDPTLMGHFVELIGRSA